MPDEPHSFAYLFERFPSFVQTFAYREAVEMVRQGMNPWLVSLRRSDDPGDLAEKLDVEVFSSDVPSHGVTLVRVEPSR